MLSKVASLSILILCFLGVVVTLGVSREEDEGLMLLLLLRWLSLTRPLAAR